MDPSSRQNVSTEIHEHAKGSALARLGRAFYFAGAGISYLVRTQRNARIHLVIGALVFAVAAWIRVDRVSWAILVLSAACVLILEGLNTAIEAAVDLASPNVHPLAKIAKDVAAGMVLIAAIAAVVVGLLLLGPGLLGKLGM